MKRWPLKETYFWERAPFFRLLLPLAVGIISYQQFHQIHSVTIFSTCFITLIVLYATSLYIKQNTTVRTAQFLLIQFALILAGWLSTYQYDIRNNNHWFGSSTEDASAFEVHITSGAEEKNRTWKYEVEVTAVIDKDQKISTRGKAFLYVYKYNAPAYNEGDLLLLPNEWQRIKNAGNPYEFDYAQFCAYKNIYYQQFLSGEKIQIQKYADEYSLNWIRRIHHWSIYQLEAYITNRETIELLKAVLTGERGLLSNTTKLTYANTGIIHVIAISGAHISIFFFLILFLLSGIKHRKYHWIKYLATLPLIWLYVLVAGAPASAVRAALMFSILGVGFASQKQQNGINQLLTTTFILLLIQPNWLFAVGFQLSFLAVLSLFIFYKPIYKLLVIPNKSLSTIWRVIAASIAAEILIAPLVVYYFHLFPLQFIIANIIAYFFMSAILILGMTIIAFSSFPSTATAIAKLSELFVTYFNQSIEFLAPYSPESFQYLQIGKSELLLIYIGIISVSIYIFQKKKKALYIGLISASLLLFLLITNNWQSHKQERLAIYNINRTGYIEHIVGKEYRVLSNSKELSTQTQFYALRPAHIQWHAWKEGIGKYKKQMLSIKNESILIINSKKDILPDAVFNILVMNYNVKEVEFQQLIKKYHPKQIVFSSIISRKRAQFWIAKRKEMETFIHIVSIDGAFIIANK